MTFFVDDTVHCGEGRQRCRLFTDGPHKQLHSFAQTLGVAHKAFKAPELIGAVVVHGGYYTLTPEQRRRAVKAGAVRVARQPADVTLAGLIAVAQAEVRSQVPGHS